MCRLGKLEKAGKLFEHALALSPRHPDVLTEYGEFLERSDVTRANHLYTRALIFAPDHSRALQNRQRTQPLVEQNDLSQLERIDRKRDELAAIPESSAALRRIKKEAYFQQIHHTAGIEGNTMTLAETRTIVETRMAVGGRSVMEHNEILGLDAAIKYINTTLVNRVGAITLDDLLQIHRRVMGHADPTAAGELRTNQVYVSEHVPPPPGRIHTLLESFIEWLNAPETLSLHPVKYAALAHYKLVFIHPFSDGNGRTSRLLMNLIMMQAGYPPVIIRKQDRYIYYRTLQLANEGDVRPFVRFIAECAEKTLDVYVWATREYVQKIGDETERSPATARHEQAEDDFVRNFNGDDLVRLRTPSAHREPQELPIDEIRLGASGPQLVEPLVQVIDDEPTQVSRGYEETTATDAYRDAARRPGESLAVYAFRLAALFEDAYPEADKQREMQAIFAGFSRQQLVVYLDDLLLMESSFSGHLQLVDAVLSALEAHGITLNTSKCHWFQPEVKFLGHQLSAAGLRKAPEYIEKVQSFPRPQTVQELRRFLGLVNFQRKFVPRCSEVARPLSELTGQSGSTALTWTPEMTDSFEQLKNEITRDVMLAFPDYSDTANPPCLWPAVNRELRAKLIDEALRSPGKYGLKLDRSVRQALRLMRLPGQPLAVELLAVFACLFDVRVLVHFGPDHPMTFCSARHSKHGNIHLHCLAGIHFNLLAETGALDEQNPVLSAYIVNEERARDGSDQGLSRRHSPEAQVKNLQSEAEETRGPACGHLFSSRCSAAAICNGQAACALLDSGAAVSLCSADSLGRLGFRDSDVRRSNVALQGLAGLTFGTEYVEAEVALSPEMKTVRVPLVIERSSSFGHCLLLGVNFLHEAGAIIDVERREVTCGNRVSPLLEQQHVPDGDALVGLTQVQRVPELPAVREHQQHNRAIRSLAHHVRRKTSRAMLLRSLRHFRKHWDRVAMVEGLVVYQFDEHRHVPVVSRDWLVELVGTTHEESAHAGRDKLIDMVTQQVFCPGAANIVADVVGACKKCQLFKPSSHVKSPPTIRITASAPFELIEADLVMLPRSGRGHIGCLVVVDHASKFGIAVPIRSKSSPAVATAFEQRVLPALLRPAARCLTDNGGEFCGAEFETVMERWGIAHVLSTPLRAQGHGAVERLNRTLGQSLRMLDGAPGDWDLRLPRAVSAYNSTLHSELGVSPAQYLLGRAHEIGDVPRVPLTTQRTWSPGHPSFAPFRVGEQVKKAIERPGNLLASKLGPRYAGPLTVTRVNDNGVTYENNFINPADQAVHTQGIEGAWSRAKLHLMRLKRGTSPELFPGHLARLWWQSRDRDDVRPFLNILQLIREAYPQ
ncbi:Adenosine monophosphate-protein transferase Fic [Amphibalanus amphitrite]|uniref:Protein adenylyltransferase Fic n=1 Tax=Amphibalanus amphitrite TaxID=1232801 RepID=A0A6A4W1Y3_AMPAM|nr:Adenosine monophosphate-protein transferase Fic [Amphibalanus amphitrite]